LDSNTQSQQLQEIMEFLEFLNRAKNKQTSKMMCNRRTTSMLNLGLIRFYYQRCLDETSFDIITFNLASCLRNILILQILIMGAQMIDVGFI